MKLIFTFFILASLFSCTSTTNLSEKLNCNKGKLELTTGSLKSFNKNDEKVALNINLNNCMPDSAIVLEDVPELGLIVPMIIVNYFNNYMRAFLGRNNSDKDVIIILNDEIEKEINHAGNFNYCRDDNYCTYRLNLVFDSLYTYNDYYESFTFGIPFYVYRENFTYTETVLLSRITLSSNQSGNIVLSDTVKIQKYSQFFQPQYLSGEELYKWVVDDMNQNLSAVLKDYIVAVNEKINIFFDKKK